jgi:putative SOS response-associated peptidase YedK
MCGRYTLYTKPEELERRFNANCTPETAEFLALPHYNIAPTQNVAVITNECEHNENRSIQLVRWGLIPSWAKDESVGNKLINARAETLLEKPSFRTAFQKRRCLVLANGFYEWRAAEKQPTKGTTNKGTKTSAKQQTTKQPMYVRLANDAPFAMAGLYESWNNPATNITVRTCTIITTEPNSLIAELHHRMAVILAPEKEALWLDNRTSEQDLLDALQPYSSDEIGAHPVSMRVNSPSVDDAELIQQIEILARSDDSPLSLF